MAVGAAVAVGLADAVFPAGSSAMISVSGAAVPLVLFPVFPLAAGSLISVRSLPEVCSAVDASSVVFCAGFTVPEDAGAGVCFTSLPPLTAGAALSLGAAVGFMVGTAVCAGLELGLGAVLAAGLALALGAVLSAGLALALGVALAAGLALGLGVALAAVLALALGVALTAGLALGLGSPLGVGLALGAASFFLTHPVSIMADAKTVSAKISAIAILLCFIFSPFTRAVLHP